MSRKINEAGIALMKKLHKFRATPYQVVSGKEKIWSIGYGHRRIVTKGLVITEKQAEVLLRSDMMPHAKFLENILQVPVNDNQFAALTIFCCHIGHENFERSVLLQLLNRGWYDQVSASIIRWSSRSEDRIRKVHRAAEAQLWKTPCEDHGSTTAFEEEDAA